MTKAVTRPVKITLLLASSLTVMAGATIAPSLPEMTEVFSHHERAELLSKLVLTLPAIFIVIASPIAGWAIDRFGRIRMILASAILYAFSGGSGYFVDDIYLLLFGRAVLGISVAGIMTTATTLIGDYFEGPARDRFMGTQGAFMALGGVLFLSLGGFLADIEWHTPFLIYFSALLVLPLVMKYLFEPEKKTVERENSGPQKFHRGLVLFIYFIALFTMILFYMVPVQIPYLLENELGVESKAMIGMAISVTTVFAALSAANYRRVRKHLHYTGIYGVVFTLTGLGYWIVSMATTYEMVLVGLAVSGLGAGFMMPNASIWTLSQVPEAIRGRIVGGLSAFLFLGQFLSPLVFEPFAAQSSLSEVFAQVAFLMVLFAAGFWFYQVRLSMYKTQPIS